MSDKNFWETVARESAARFAAREAELTVQLEAALEEGRRASVEYDTLQKRASSLPEVLVIDRDGKPVKDAVMGVDFSPDGKSAICVRVLDLPETVDRISELERQRDEAVARADVADYTREALAAKCKELEARFFGHATISIDLSGARASFDESSFEDLRKRLHEAATFGR